MMTTSEIPDADDLDRRGDAIADAQQLPSAYLREIATRHHQIRMGAHNFHRPYR